MAEALPDPIVSLSFNSDFPTGNPASSLNENVYAAKKERW